jgi:hypothetical protein
MTGEGRNAVICDLVTGLICSEVDDRLLIIHTVGNQEIYICP